MCHPGYCRRRQSPPRRGHYILAQDTHQFSGRPLARRCLTRRRDALFLENLGDEPYDQGEIFALFIGWKDDGILVGIRGAILALHFQRGVAVERVHCHLTRASCHFIVVTSPVTAFVTHLMRDTEAIRNLRSILRGTLRVIINDNRAFVGTFVGTDKSLNILLLNTEEYRLDTSENAAGRYVGQVMIPWRIIQTIGLQIGETNAQPNAEQVRVPAKGLPSVKPLFPESNNAAVYLLIHWVVIPFDLVHLFFPSPCAHSI